MPVTPGSRPRRPALRAFHRPRVWLAVWAFGWVLCVVLSLVSPVAIDAPSGSDKFGHLLAYFVLTAWAVQLFATWRAQALAAAALVALGIALELAQAGFTTDRLAEMRPEKVHDLLARCDAFRRPERVARIALVCEADKRGRLGLQDQPYPSGALFVRLHAAAMTVSATDAVAAGLEGPAVGEWLRRQRIAAIKNLL